PAAGEEQGGAEKTEDPTKRVLVKVGDIEITQFEFDIEFKAALERMSPDGRGMFENPHGRRQFLNVMVDEKIWVNGALDAGLGEDTEVLALTRMYRHKALVRTFYERQMVDRSRPSETEIRAFYDTNQHRFMTPPRIRARHILLADSVEAAELLSQIQAGASFKDLAREKSIDEQTAAKGGDIGLLMRGMALPPGLGGSPAFEDSLYSLQPGLVSRVIKSTNGYHIIFVEEKMEPKQRPFEDVEKQIHDGFFKERVSQLRKEFFDEFKKKYQVEYFIPDSSIAPDAGTLPPDVASTPEELFQAAMDSNDSRQRIAIYEELVKKFPESKYASQAQFMIGFIYSEELSDYENAEAAFRTVVEKYPESELIDSARWMIENMRDESQSVGTVEDVKRKAKKSSQPAGK
ncbi:MAG: peptidyl-prolyl cis-trans isomerase, partial [Candidatus Eiseniibacteriota bacterium]